MERNLQTQPTVREPERLVPVTGEYDVVVAGGGIAGVAAAVAAARAGATVGLLERSFALGGLATLGNVTVWLPLCDGRGRQVSFGLAEELLKLSVADLGHENAPARFQGIPQCWQPGGDPLARRDKRYRVSFNPCAYMLALEPWVIAAGVKLLYDTRVCAVRRRGRRITHLMIENKSGRGAVACGTVVDATGDADVCFLGREPTESLDSNVRCGWYYYLRDGVLALDPFSSRANCREASREGGEGPFFRGDDAAEVTDQVLGSRAVMRERIAALRAREPNADIQVFTPPMIACFRMTRRLAGALSLGARHRHAWFDDAVGVISDWREAGPVYAVPLGSLRGVRNRNLLAAGRCMSADTTLWDVTRAIPPCAVTGQAAGLAAALATQTTGGDVHSLPVEALQAGLRAQGVQLDPALVQPVA